MFLLKVEILTCTKMRDLLNIANVRWGREPNPEDICVVQPLADFDPVGRLLNVFMLWFSCLKK